MEIVITSLEQDFGPSVPHKLMSVWFLGRDVMGFPQRADVRHFDTFSVIVPTLSALRMGRL